MKRYDVKSFPALAAVILFASVIALTTGCVERRVQDVPVYRAQTVYQPQQEPGQQTLYQPQPGAVQPPAVNWQTPEPVPTYTNAPPQPTVTVVAQAPPPPQVEVVPVAPGPDYYWVPGYWYWGGPRWIWIGGRWTIRPWHHASGSAAVGSVRFGCMADGPEAGVVGTGMVGIGGKNYRTTGLGGGVISRTRSRGISLVETEEANVCPGDGAAKGA